MQSAMFARLSALFMALVVALGPGTAGAQGVAPPLPDGFADEVVWGGLTRPTAVRFAPDGTVFVAEKSGILKVFDSVDDPTPTVFADLRTNVHNFWDRGLLGLAIDPGWPDRPYVYVLYTYDAVPGGVAPRWGVAGATADTCPNPPGATDDGCVVQGRLSRLTAGPGGGPAGPEEVLIEGWCQQYPSHSIADLAFGPDGALYVSAGDGASFNWVDYGQGGGSPGSPTPRNACGDPPGAVGDVLTPPSAEGGALRSQDSLTPGDPQTLDGAVLRIDPATGLAPATNPLGWSVVPGDPRVIAHGLRNPFRIKFRPGTNELWIGDVGWTRFEEINRLAPPTAAPANFGWPCYEGVGRQFGYDGADLALCEGLYATPGAVRAPFLAYDHQETIVPNGPCGTGGSAITGLAFRPAGAAGGSWPAPYDGALYFADNSRQCIWAIFAGADGAPDPSARGAFAIGAAAVDLQFGPDGALYYANLGADAVHRITYFAANRPPVAVVDADPLNGPTPLLVTFDGTLSSDPDPGDTLTFDWDLDGDGVFGDAAGPTPTWTYDVPGSYVVTLRVTDPDGVPAEATLTITADDEPPLAVIDAPAVGTTWRVGDVVSFAGHGEDLQDGPLPASALTWELVLHHCAPSDPTNCHTHSVESYVGTAGGSFLAPEHEYPAYLELRLTVTDSAGLTDTVWVELQPQTTTLWLESVPPGLTLGLNGEAAAAPWARDVIVGSRSSLSAGSPQNLGGVPYRFVAWSDGGAASHEVTAGSADATFVATYEPDCADPNVCVLSCPADDVWEPNDSGPAAVLIPANADVFAIACPNDADWYAFPAVAGCDITVTVDFVHADGDLHARLLSPTGVQLRGGYSATDDEVLTAVAPTTGDYVVHVYGFQGASNRYGLRADVVCGPGVEVVCDDGLDGDGDGLVDCADPDCAGSPACVVTPEVCDNGADDDGDGLVDCADPDCAADPACALPEIDCANGLDDDGDGLVDCADLDCAGVAGCAAQCPADDGFEQNDQSATARVLPGSGAIDGVVCTNDDDWYGIAAAAGCTVAVDLRFVHALGDLNLRLVGPDGVQRGGSYSASDDEHVTAVATVGGVHTIHVYGFHGAENAYRLEVAVTCPGDVEAACSNGVDDDGDGLIDCADPDCVADPACVVLPEVCTGGLDEDGDGLVDCADPDCAAAPACAPIESDCGNGVDDDGDGLVDCADPDCAGVAGCAPACPADDTWEQNDFAAAAAPLLEGALVDGVVCSNDADWFAVVAAAGCTIEVDLLFAHAVGDLNLQLLGPDGVQLAASYSASDDEHVAAVAQVGGAHAIHVYGFHGAESPYGLLATVTCP